MSHYISNAKSGINMENSKPTVTDLFLISMLLGFVAMQQEFVFSHMAVRALFTYISMLQVKLVVSIENRCMLSVVPFLTKW